MKRILSHLFLATAAALTVQPILGLLGVEQKSSPGTAQTQSVKSDLCDQEITQDEKKSSSPLSEDSSVNWSTQNSPSTPQTTTSEDLDAAIANLSDEIHHHSRKADAYIERGWEYGQVGNYKMAIADFNKAIKLKPRDTEAYVKRAWMNCNLHLYGKAIADATLALKLNPKCADAYDVRAAANSSLGREEMAAKDGSESLRLLTRR
jgi:tetratricopeptide (TPR) repeat protein